jgi:hypothetical protein
MQGKKLSLAIGRLDCITPSPAEMGSATVSVAEHTHPVSSLIEPLRTQTA